jgi:hypothetical protein
VVVNILLADMGISRNTHTLIATAMVSHTSSVTGSLVILDIVGTRKIIVNNVENSLLNAEEILDHETINSVWLFCLTDVERYTCEILYESQQDSSHR